MSEQEKQAIVEELKDWAIVTGRPLPYPAEMIAEYEARGLVVDLADGSISDAEECMTRTVALSSHGRHSYHVMCGSRIYGQGYPIEQCENEDQRCGLHGGIECRSRRRDRTVPGHSPDGGGRMNTEQIAIWNKHVDEYRQHRAEYLHLLHLDEDQVAREPRRMAQMKPLMIGLRQLIAECEAVLAVDEMIKAVAA